jgi:molybdopterin-guanine dinucleotide biosynthesis protein A
MGKSGEVVMGTLPMTALILAGGKSRRMGCDKALLPMGESTILENLVSLVSPLFGEVLIVVHDKEKFSGLDFGGAKICTDILKDRGPLGGIYTGLFYSTHRAGCVLTCDMPGVDAALLLELFEEWKENYDLMGECCSDVFCFEEPGRPHQPFPGIYMRRSRTVMRLLLEQGERSVKKFFEMITVKTLPVKAERAMALTNMNTVEDYQRFLKEKT